VDLVLLGGDRDRVANSVAGTLVGVAAAVRRQGGAVGSFAVVDATSLDVGPFAWSASRPVSMTGVCGDDSCRLTIGPHDATEVSLNLPFTPRGLDGVAQSRWRFDAARTRLALTLSAGSATTVVEIRK
jgi:hypothetical protein